MYLQTVLDCYSRHAWGRLYTRQTAGDLGPCAQRNVLPFFEAHEARVYTILSDNGGASSADAMTITLSCSCSWRIEHRTTKVRRPQSNGFIERLGVAPCWMNTSVSKGGRPGMNQWSRCRQTGQLSGSLQHPAPHQGRMMESNPTACSKGSEIDTEGSAH